jgi:hypothetical protein
MTKIVFNRCKIFKITDEFISSPNGITLIVAYYLPRSDIQFQHKLDPELLQQYRLPRRDNSEMISLVLSS